MCNIVGISLHKYAMHFGLLFIILVVLHLVHLINMDRMFLHTQDYGRRFAAPYKHAFLVLLLL